MSHSLENVPDVKEEQEDLEAASSKLLNIAQSIIQDYCDYGYEAEVLADDTPVYYFTFKVEEVCQEDLISPEDAGDVLKRCADMVNDPRDKVRVTILSDEDVQDAIDVAGDLLAQNLITEDRHRDFMLMYGESHKIFVKIRGDGKSVYNILIYIIYQIAARLRKVQYRGRPSLLVFPMRQPVLFTCHRTEYKTNVDSIKSL